MRMDTKQEKQHKDLKGRLIGLFVLTLAAILVSETLLTTLINYALLPAVQTAFPQTLLWDQTLTGSQLIALLGGALLILVLRFAGWIFPFTGSLTLSAQSRLESRLTHYIPQLRAALPSLSRTQGIVLFLVLTGLLLLKLFPYLFFGGLYIRFVVRSVDRIRRKAEEEYREMDRNRNLMLSDIAHDIRNPITTISGYAQALEDGMVDDPDRQRHYLHAIRKKSGRVNTLVSLLFEYARLHSTGFSLDKKPVDLCELVREAAADMYTDAEEQKMEILAEIVEEPVTVYADPVQLTRTLTNLLTNAIRYNPPGTKILTAVRVDREESGSCSVLIADTGIPIPEETAARIFDPFSRGDAARPTDGGSGLGLSIADTIIRLHGWSLTLETNIPGYTKGFVIRIPW